MTLPNRLTPALFNDLTGRTVARVLTVRPRSRELLSVTRDTEAGGVG